MWLGFLVSSSELVRSLNYSYAGYIVAFCGGALISTGFLGFLGTWKNQKLYLLLFIAISFTVGILLVSFAGVILYIKELTGQLFMDEDTCRKGFSDADELNVLAGEVFCSDYCPCTVSDENFSMGYTEGSAANALDCNPCENIQACSSSTQASILEWMNFTLGYQGSIDSCAITAEEFNKAYYPSQDFVYAPFLKWMEETLQCSGLCSEQKIMLFSDVNQNSQKSPCFTKMKYWAHENMQGYGAIALSFGLYQFIACGFAIGLACCAKNIRKVAMETISEAKH